MKIRDEYDKKMTEEFKKMTPKQAAGSMTIRYGYRDAINYARQRRNKAVSTERKGFYEKVIKEMKKLKGV